MYSEQLFVHLMSGWACTFCILSSFLWIYSWSGFALFGLAAMAPQNQTTVYQKAIIEDLVDKVYFSTSTVFVVFLRIYDCTDTP